MNALTSIARRVILHVSLALLPLVTLKGCATIDLAELQVESLDLSVEGSTMRYGQICPGIEAPLIAGAILKGGNRLTTDGTIWGKIPWNAFFIYVEGGSTRYEPSVLGADNQFVTLNARETFGHPAKVRIVARAHPEQSREIQLKARYDCEFEADFRGRRGDDGYEGETGWDWASGGDGGDGDDGRPGNAVHVVVALVKHPETGQPLLQVEATSGNWVERFLVDSERGQLLLNASGGRGGDGGDGGDADVCQYTYGEQCDPSGCGGQGGDAGNGGDGGSFTVRVDTDAPKALDRIRFLNEGGAAGWRGFSGSDGKGLCLTSFLGWGNKGAPGTPGPPPSIVFEPVEPLWDSSNTPDS